MKENVRIFWAIDNKILAKGFESLFRLEIQNNVINQSLSHQNILDYHFKEDDADQTLLVLQIPFSRSDTNLKLYKFLKKRPWIKVVVMMDQFDFRRTQFFFNLGVMGIIFEDIEASDFVSIMRNVLEGKKGISSDMKEKIIHEFCSKKEELLIDVGNSDAVNNRHEHSDFRKNLYSLTKREKEILKLICDGKLTREIADQLFISLHTIETHRRNILNKMEVKNTAHMVKVAVSNGLV